MNPIYKEFQYGDQTVVMGTNKVAKQAAGSVTVTIGDTVVLTTVVGARVLVQGRISFPDGELSRKPTRLEKFPVDSFAEGRPSEKT